MAIPAHPPVIDLSDFRARREEICSQLLEAATGIGFFYVKGHGISQKVVDAAFTAASKFVALPAARKAEFPKRDWAHTEVIFGRQTDSEPGGPLWEAYSHVNDVHPVMAAAWPTEAECPGYREDVVAFHDAMHPVAMQIVSCLATALGLPADFFDKAVTVGSTENASPSSFNCYSSTEGRSLDPATLRVLAHTDESLITLLHTSPGSVGLEVAAGRDGKAVQGDVSGLYAVDNWIQVPHLPGHVVVNIGDCLELWSGGVLKSNFHRVRQPHPDEYQGSRISLAYFVYPNRHHKIQGPSGSTPATTHAELIAQKGSLYIHAFAEDSGKDAKKADAGYAIGLPPVQAVTA